MGKRIVAIVAATVIALVGAVFVMLYARGADNRAIAAASPASVYVSSAAIPAGTSLKEAVRLKLLTQTATAAKALPAGALTSVTPENGALLALTDIPPGQYVLATAFGETVVGDKAIQVPNGKLAISVQLSDPARVGNFVTPGSMLTIFASYKLKQLDTSEKSKVFNEQDVRGTSVLLDDIQVIGMGNTALQSGQQGAQNGKEGEGDAAAQQGPSFLVTLAVTPAQATKLVHGINQYVLYAGLRGDEVKVDPKLTVNDMTIAKEIQ
jgi:pilus assembly protein CpaB